MDVLELQFQALREKFRDAALTRVPNGTAIISIPGWSLPPGWSSTSTTVYFVAPVGYPAARPDTFWTSHLRLSNGNVPKNTGNNPAEGLPSGELTWFSWHPSVWNPNGDNLLSYLRMIGDRLRRAE